MVRSAPATTTCSPRLFCTDDEPFALLNDQIRTGVRGPLHRTLSILKLTTANLLNGVP